MDIKLGSGFPSGALSNLAPHKFVIDGVECNSMEGFLQSLKFSNPDMQREVCKMTGKYAKSKGAKKNWQTHQTLYWQGKEYKRDSKEYQELLDKAYDALATNEKFRKALIASKGATLTHSIGKRKIEETVLTSQEFISRLNRLRAKVLSEQ